jgi:GMP synthase (glutamine-hydrolysing)
MLVVRCEVDDAYCYHCDALASHLPDAREYDFPAEGTPPSVGDADGVVITGSTAGVYEEQDRPWIGELEAFVRDLVDRRVPTLGVCFGHQVVNAALGGSVEPADDVTRLVETDLAEDPLFEGVSPVVPAVHGDRVTETGDRLDVIASTDYNEAFGTRHAAAPLWTVQFHPEFTADLVDRLRADFGWTDTEHSFESVETLPVFDNFRRLAARRGRERTA